MVFSQKLLLMGFAISLTMSHCYSQESTPSESSKKSSYSEEAVVTDDHRRLALIVGINDYKNEEISDLAGPVNDAGRIYELLTGKNGYGFPKENIYKLLDDEATLARFVEVFENGLINRVKSPKDVVLIFFAGHGSQVKDRNRDEPDEWDETLVFHDSRTGDVPDLIDDRLNQMLARIYKKTQQITLVLDSCNSGSADRGEKGTYLARWVNPQVTPPNERFWLERGYGEQEGKDQAETWVPESMKHMVFFSAAGDGTSALEAGGSGIFTEALVKVWSKVDSEPVTYSKAARQIRNAMRSKSPQVPYFQGELFKEVLGNTSRKKPVSWEIISLEPSIVIGGPPLPGLGKGAEVRIYDSNAEPKDFHDPGKAIATLVVDKQMTKLQAAAKIDFQNDPNRKPKVGDLAIMVRPGDDALKIKVRIRPVGEKQGIASDRAEKLKNAIRDHPEAKMLVELSDTQGDFELIQDIQGRLQLLGPENRVRVTYKSPNDREAGVVAANLWQHARVKALLALEGEGAGIYQDNETLQVRLVPALQQHPCSDGHWQHKEPFQNQPIPLCHPWNVEVTVSENSQKSLLIGGLVLSMDGSIFGFPVDTSQTKVDPGKTHTFRASIDTFVGGPPLNVKDQVLVFGTEVDNPVAWNELSMAATTRGKGGTALYRALDRYLTPGTRGQARMAQPETSPWTMSAVSMYVEANPSFADLSPGETITDFDIRPYLPDEKESSLYRVLQKTKWLTGFAEEQRLSVRSHSWNKSEDEANLKLGIDSARAVWFAFTRAGAPFTEESRFLSIQKMTGSQSPMAELCDDCTNDPNLQIGDILVYHDKDSGTGYALMVADPLDQAAWGIAPLEKGAKNYSESPVIAYQRIPYSADWKRMGYSSMVRVACWRYRAFGGQARAHSGLLGAKALENACDPKKECGQQ
jgi:hypothetical protein